MFKHKVRHNKAVNLGIQESFGELERIWPEEAKQYQETWAMMFQESALEKLRGHQG